MATAAAASTRAKEDYYVLIKNNNYVRINLVKAAISAELATAAGYVQELPNGANQIGNSKEDAMNNGCVGFNVYYKGNTGRLQAAKLIVSPSKADTFRQAAMNSNYRDKKIENVRVPRRVKYTF